MMEKKIVASAPMSGHYLCCSVLPRQNASPEQMPLDKAPRFTTGLAPSFPLLLSLVSSPPLQDANARILRIYINHSITVCCNIIRYSNDLAPIIYLRSTLAPLAGHSPVQSCQHRHLVRLGDALLWPLLQHI